MTINDLRLLKRVRHIHVADRSFLQGGKQAVMRIILNKHKVTDLFICLIFFLQILQILYIWDVLLELDIHVFMY